MADNYRRRLSYASVASGATPQPVPRSGHLSHLSSATPSSSYPPQYYQESRTQRRQSNYDQDTSSTGVVYRKPPLLPAYARRFQNLPGMSGSHLTSSPMLVPEYLRESRYVAKLEAEQMARAKRERQHASGANSNAASLSSSAANSNLPRIAPSHRGMTYDVIESNPPRDEDELMPLSSRWSDQDKYPGLDISVDGLDVRYSGAASKADIEAASIRADYPVTPACGMAYFEVTITSKSKDSAIAIGFSTAEASLERLPGWETHSWGYHGDDGKIFSGEHSGRSYGPTFSANDVVGCGIDFKSGHAFFTINGRDLGPSFREIKDQHRLFPTIGMKKYSGASVTVNFGHQPFIFDIREKMASNRDSVRHEISRTKVSSIGTGLDEDSLIQELVAQYLAHDGYVETARAFNEELTRERNALNGTQARPGAIATSSDDTEAVHRQRIRSAVLEGNVERALEITESRFPDVLKANPQILFRLKCRKWVELFSKAVDLKAQQTDSKQKQKAASNGFGGHGNQDSAVVEDDFAQDMELDEQQAIDTEGVSLPSNAQLSSDLDATSTDQYDELLNEAMTYGQVLQRDYRDAEDIEWSKTLRDIFSLVAYESPRDSVHGSLLDRKGRVAVAEELNSAILVSLGLSPAAALENVYKQTEVLLDILSQEGGPAAFVNLQKDLHEEPVPE